MARGSRLAVVVAVAAVVSVASLASAEEYWVSEMSQVHATFTGTRGTIARFGDSITYSGAFFKPLQGSFANATAEEQAALDWLHAYLAPSCWTWQDDAVAASNGCYSGTTSDWPLQTDQSPPSNNITHWLNKLKPELAVIMWGTNDLGPSNVTTYTNNMRQVIQACKNYGTIPLLTTIPPRRGYDAKSAEFAQAMRDLALELKVPVIDYNQEILTRQPGSTWDNTLISSDGVHPSWNGSTAQDFSPSSLNSNGYLLRNWLTLHRLYDVYLQILQFDPPIQHATATVYDTASSDVPGPQPIRVFPVPAAVGWQNARLIYDNYAEGLTFSPDPRPSFYQYVNLPLSNSQVAIHGVRNNLLNPLIDDTFQLYVTEEGSDADPRCDNRFPYHIPRLARSHVSNYLAVEFDLVAPVSKFGVFLPASANSWGNSTGQYYDQNFTLQDRSVWVTIFDDSGASQTQYVSLKVDGAATWCPFLAVEWDGTHKITKVSVIHDVNENADRGVSFMDLYTATSKPGDINNDGLVNIFDLLRLAAAWNTVPADAAWDAACDLNADNAVNIFDLLILADNWNT